MHNLEYFHWNAYPPLLSPTTGPDGTPHSDNVWAAVKTLKSLRQLRAVDLTCDWYVPHWRMDASPRMVTSGVWLRFVQDSILF